MHSTLHRFSPPCFQWRLLTKFQTPMIFGSVPFLIPRNLNEAFLVDSGAKTPAKEEVVTMAARLSLASKVSPLLYQLKDSFLDFSLIFFWSILCILCLILLFWMVNLIG